MNEKYSEKGSGMKRRLFGFACAFKGIFILFKTQRNARIHLLAAILVTTAGFIFSLTPLEWGLVVLAMGVVLAAEAFNTAIELLTDKISPEYDKTAGAIKDVAAGAVLLAAIAAAITGIIIIAQKITAWPGTFKI
jgi:diacylglycerol kinase